MRQTAFLSLLAPLAASAAPIAFLSYFDSSDCSNNAAAVLPIPDGNFTLCRDTSATGLATLAGVMSTGDPDCASVIARPNDATSIEEYDPTDASPTWAVKTFGTCQASSSYPGLYFSYTAQPSTTESATDGPSAAGMVFLQYYESGDSCTGTLKVRLPIFEGGNKFKWNDGATCAEAIEGITATNPDQTKVNTCGSTTDNCFFVETEDGVAEDIHYGACKASSIFNGCRFVYSKKAGVTTVPDGCTLPTEPATEPPISAAASLGSGMAIVTALAGASLFL